MSTFPGRAFLGRKLGSIRARLAGVIALFALALVALVAALVWGEADEIYAARQDQLKVVIELAYKAVDHEYQEFKAGRIPESEARERAKATVRAMRYHGTDYLFIQDDRNFTVVNGARPESEGVDTSGQKDSSGKDISAAMHGVANARGEGFVDYHYARPGVPVDQASPKLAFVKTFAPWRWMLGTGVYIDDVRATIWSRIRVASSIGFSFLFVIGAIAGWLTLGLSARLGALGNAMTTLASGRGEVELPPMAGDEIDAMIQSVRVFQEAAGQKAQLEREAEAARRETDAIKTASDKERISKALSLESATRALGEGMARLAAGDLVFRIDTAFAGDLDMVRIDFNRSMEKLRETLLSIRGGADGIKSGAREISNASDEMTNRVERQARSLRETALSLDEVTSSVKKTAEGASRANAAVAHAMADANASGGVVREAIAAMDVITQSSRHIGQIISVIDEIAFQTNLLALNAGVEAARAGDAGRGFAVVASEVRALAQRSTEAAREIKTLIGASSAQVEQGVSIVGRNGQALERISARIMEMNAVITEIAVAAREEADGLQEINATINGVDQGTRENAAMIEEATAAARALAEETDELARLVGQFKLAEGAPSGRDDARRAGGAKLAKAGMRRAS